MNFIAPKQIKYNFNKQILTNIMLHLYSNQKIALYLIFCLVVCVRSHNAPVPELYKIIKIMKNILNARNNFNKLANKLALFEFAKYYLIR